MRGHKKQRPRALSQESHRNGTGSHDLYAKELWGKMREEKIT